MCAKVYYPFEDVAMRPTFGPMLPGSAHPVLVGNPMLRGGPFVGLPGYGMEAAEAATNLVTDPDFPDLTNWPAWGTPSTREVGSQFAMDQGEFLGGLHIVGDASADGAQGAVIIADATDYAPSVWVYVISGTLRMLCKKGGAETQNIDSTKIREWERLEMAFTSTGVAGVMYLGCSGGAAEGWFWMPQWELGTYAKPAGVGTQPASCVYTPSPISETQTPWSALCVVTPDWAYDTVNNYYAWALYEDAGNYVTLFYFNGANKWYFTSYDGASAEIYSALSTHVRGDKIHMVCTCDGYNAYLYVNGAQTGPFVMKSIQPVNLILGALTTAAGNPLDGVVDDFAFLVGAAIPEFRVQEIYRASLRGVPLHGIVESLT